VSLDYYYACKKVKYWVTGKFTLLKGLLLVGGWVAQLARVKG